jgi:hypothetical protein
VSARSYRLLAIVLWRVIRWYVRRRRRSRRLSTRWATFSRGLFVAVAMTMLAVLVRRVAS